MFLATFAVRFLQTGKTKYGIGAALTLATHSYFGWYATFHLLVVLPVLLGWEVVREPGRATVSPRGRTSSLDPTAVRSVLLRHSRFLQNADTRPVRRPRRDSCCSARGFGGRQHRRCRGVARQFTGRIQSTIGLKAFVLSSWKSLSRLSVRSSWLRASVHSKTNRT